MKSLLTIPQDRDYTPYAYPAVFGVPYLRDGHVDIKPPLIHWSYKLWWTFANFCGISKCMSMAARLRFLPLIGLILSVCCLSITGHTQAAALLAFLLLSPTLWPHMANTEWLTVALICLAMALPAPLSWCCLGLMPWANQKNALIIPSLALALGLHPLSWACLFLFASSVVILSYLYATKRLELFIHWCWFVPALFGANRTWKRNTLSASRLLIPCVALMAPLVAVMSWGPWALVALSVVAVMVWSKQIVPHHFILLALPVAMSAHVGPFALAALALVWIPRDGICWWRPDLTYRFTFSLAGGDYGQMIADLNKIEKFLRENTPADEVIWVNGFENQVYLNTMRRAWRIEIPELPGHPAGDPPRYIVHCNSSAKRGDGSFDYEAWNYEPAMISTSGEFTLLLRRGK